MEDVMPHPKDKREPEPSFGTDEEGDVPPAETEADPDAWVSERTAE